MQKITPALWIDDAHIAEALEFYTTTFKDGKILDKQSYPDGRILAATFELAGLRFQIIGGNDHFQLTESISFSIECQDQAEVDYFWNAFTANGGAESMCGWCKDRFGLSWQVIPKALPKAMGGSDKAGAGRAMQAMLGMKKIIVADIEKAYAG